MKRPDLVVSECLTCGGRGEIPAIGTGAVMQREREERDLPRVSKAHPRLGLAYHFGYSESYILDLEKDARPWTWELVRRYREAIEETIKYRLSEEETT